MWIDCAKNGFSFALALSPADFGLFPFLRPGIRNGSRIGQPGFVFKKYYAAYTSPRSFFIVETASSLSSASGKKPFLLKTQTT
jgi:hypothetical protein